ncbi:MAG: phosphoribosylaminoimidazolesuccinocarboxamide synthase [Bacteroidetes bacterium]|nr:phosphoribosylaminoimidazolesuccinocarboxamide synthase [Bacteroidota bacterium]
MAEKTTLIYEGKAKKVFATTDPDLVIQEFKDDATAFNGLKKGQIADKGVVNNTISSALFTLLESKGIPTHYVRKLSDREMLIKRLTILPVELVVRNVAAGSLVKRYGIKEGMVLGQPIIECYYKNDSLGDPLMNDDHVVMFNLATREQLAEMKKQALQINQLLSAFFLDRRLKLVDFKLEFGVHKNQILLGDEISPDTCRFWDAVTNEKMDKDRFRFDLGLVEETYQEVLSRITGAVNK